MNSIGRNVQRTLAGLILLMLAACGADRAMVPNGGPQLVQDVTLAPTISGPTRVLSPTPSPIMVPVVTSELNSLLQVVTVESSFVLVTPTLPPSKTPTLTPTNTATASATARPTITPNTYLMTTSIPIVVPPSGVVPIPTPMGQTGSVQGCSISWFFTQVVPATCALNPPLVSSGSFQQFQNGVMLWIGQQSAIYVLYDSANFPRWQVFNDTYANGMPDTDPAYNNPPPYTWQPKRGFGLIWRTQGSARDRLGWAVTEEEIAFTTQVQIASNGTIFISEPRGGIYSLVPDGSDWKRYQ